MCRLLGYISMSPVSLETAVGAAFRDFVNLSNRHADGWGLAQVDRQSGTARVHRMPEPAMNSSEFKALAQSSQCNGAIFHLRWATPGLPIRSENTHPFVEGRYAFMHNGAISAAIAGLVPPDLSPLLQGDTDSEKYFLVALECIARRGPFPGTIEAVQKIRDSCDYSSLNAMLLTPDELIVVSLYRPERIAPDEPDDYYEIRYNEGDEQIVVASTGWPQEGWTRLPNHSVSRIDRKTLAVSTRRLT